MPAVYSPADTSATPHRSSINAQRYDSPVVLHGAYNKSVASGFCWPKKIWCTNHLILSSPRRFDKSVSLLDWQGLLLRNSGRWCLCNLIPGYIQCPQLSARLDDVMAKIQAGTYVYLRGHYPTSSRNWGRWSWGGRVHPLWSWSNWIWVHTCAAMFFNLRMAPVCLIDM
jgi:hypothetical protein